jgi:type 1 glutamine amidotransferase
VLLTIGEKTYEGGEIGSFRPISWYHEFNGGRLFYTAFGHREEFVKQSGVSETFAGSYQVCFKKRRNQAHFHIDKSKE